MIFIIEILAGKLIEFTLNITNKIYGRGAMG